MPARRVNPNLVKLLRTYSVSELAIRLDVHKNTIRNWLRDGLEPIDKRQPIVFLGEMVRQFLTARNRSRKHHCGPGQMYCFRCRQPREPAMGMVDYVPLRATSGNLRAICDTCDAIMHRSARMADLVRIMPGLAVQFVEASPRLSGRGSPSLNCDSNKRGAP